MRSNASWLASLRNYWTSDSDSGRLTMPSGPQAMRLAAELEIAEVEAWLKARDSWREAHASLIATRRTLAEDGLDADPESLARLRATLEEHLSRAKQLGEENPWMPPGRDDQEAGRSSAGMHVLDALIGRFLEQLGREGTPLRAVGERAAEEIRQKARERWDKWATESRGEARPPPWERWRNGALFPTILARVLWRGEVRDRLARLRAKPAGTIYAVFRSIARVSSSQLQIGLDGQGHRAILRHDHRNVGDSAVADLPTLPEDIFAHGLTLLGSCYTLPTVEWLVERAHAQALDRVDRPDVIEVEGGWEAFAAAVLERRSVHPVERARLHTLARMLASTPIRWQDGARSSSLFMLFEDAAAAGRGRGRSVIRFTLDSRLLAHEHHRARERFGPAPGPAQWADWRIVPLPRPRIIAPLPGSPRDTYGPQTVALRLLWLFFTRHGDQLLKEPRLVEVALTDRRAIAEEAQLPNRLVDPLLEHLVRQGAVIASHGSRFAPADAAARAFIAQGWSRSRVASENGQRASRGKAARLHPR